MAQHFSKSAAFARALLRDRRGNAIMITAAALVPLIGMVGGAVDMSRLYLTKARLQSACDAGALAARRTMVGLTWNQANEDVANKYFTMNFPDGRYGTTNLSFEYDADNEGAVEGAVTVRVPMTLMRVFDAGSKTVAVTCTADLNLPNSDIMMVLDTTLSMNDINPGDSVSRISALRTAVMSFYDTLEAAKPPGANVRYGFVPYSHTVNVGMLLRGDWVQDIGVYDSRTPDGTHIQGGSTQGATTTSSTWATISGSNGNGTPYFGPSENCVAPPRQNWSDTYTGWSAWNPNGTTLPRTRTRERTRNGTTFSASLNSNGVCTITPRIYNQFKERQTETVRQNPNAGNQNNPNTRFHWVYGPVSYDLRPLKGAGGSNPVTGGSINTPVGNNHTNRTVTWNASNACIEERATRRTNETVLTPKHDMDIDLVPSVGNPDTQWKPYLPSLYYGRNANNVTRTGGWQYSGSAPTYTRNVNINSTINWHTPHGQTTSYGACPSPSRKLGSIDRNTLNSYMNGLAPRGFTYPDIGMVWGVRLMSREGLFADEHAAADAGGAAVRHLILMADGVTETKFGAYSAWGMAAVARRRTPTNAVPTDASENAVSEANLTSLCTTAKNNKNITVWVIAFGTDLTPLLTSCASPNRAFKAENAAELSATFTNIATQMAELRLTK